MKKTCHKVLMEYELTTLHAKPTNEPHNYVPTPQNGQTHSNNSSTAADELFEYV